ncbi:MAG: hypothetical protein MUF05_03925 [Candidatus Omnitrophica bacterium]|nr:hypothetical protein [Candidatus Omnitrophota bacterium]
MKKILLTSLICLPVMALGAYFRLYPLINKGPAYAKKMATEVVHAHFKDKLRLYIQKTYPNLDTKEKGKLLRIKFKESLIDDAAAISAMIEEGTRELLKSDNIRVSPFLLEADSYNFYGLTENIYKTGKISPQIEKGKYFNPLMLAPFGKWEPLSLHPFLGYYLYRVINLFETGVELMEAIKWLVILISVISVIPFFLVSLRLRISALNTFVGLIFFILGPLFVQRTVWGWYDTDVYNIFFPTLILLSVFSMFLALDKPKKPYLIAMLTSFLTAAYELFWHGWGFIFVIMLAALPFILLADYKFNHKQYAKKIILCYATYLISTFFCISILISPHTFLYTFEEGLKMLSSFLGAKFDLWPNIFLTVGETQSMSLEKVSFLVGGNYNYIYFPIAGCLMFLFSSFRLRNIRLLFSSILLTVFLLGTLYLALKAVRFSILLSVPAALCFTLFLEYTSKGVIYLVKNKFKKQHFVKPAKSIMAVIFLALTIIPISSADLIAGRITPIYNQTWDNAMQKIKKLTPENSIINTWWCPGHFITAVAKRRVVADGASQQEPQTYWIANALLSNSEELSLGILRMLDLSGNKALEYLEYEHGMIVSDATSLLKKILPLNQQEADAVLASEGFTPEEKTTILRMTHQTPFAAYIMVYTEMVDSYAALPYIGNWDFKKAEYLILNTQSNKNIRIPSRDSKDFLDFIFSLSGGLPACSPRYNEVARKDNKIRFENNFVLNIDTKEGFIISQKDGSIIQPKSIFYAENGQLQEKKYASSTLPYSVLLAENNNSYAIFLLDESVAKSFLFKLYYLKGKTLKHFTPVFTEESPTKDMVIMLYRINW